MQSVVEITAHLQRSYRLTHRKASLHTSADIHRGSGTATVSRPTSEVKPIVVLPISILL